MSDGDSYKYRVSSILSTGHESNYAESNEYHEPYLDMVSKQVEKATLDFKEDRIVIFNSYNKQLSTFKKDYSWCPYIQINPVIGADQNVYSCHDKAYNIDEGMIFSIKNQRFKDGWFLGKSKFYQINPEKICSHHCIVNEKNKIILDYLDVDKNHLEFV